MSECHFRSSGNGSCRLRAYISLAHDDYIVSADATKGIDVLIVF